MPVVPGDGENIAATYDDICNEELIAPFVEEGIRPPSALDKPVSRDVWKSWIERILYAGGALPSSILPWTCYVMPCCSDFHRKLGILQSLRDYAGLFGMRVQILMLTGHATTLQFMTTSILAHVDAILQELDGIVSQGRMSRQRPTLYMRRALKASEALVMLTEFGEEAGTNLPDYCRMALNTRTQQLGDLRVAIIHNLAEAVQEVSEGRKKPYTDADEVLSHFKWENTEADEQGTTADEEAPFLQFAGFVFTMEGITDTGAVVFTSAEATDVLRELCSVGMCNKPLPCGEATLEFRVRSFSEEPAGIAKAVITISGTVDKAAVQALRTYGIEYGLVLQPKED